MGQVYCFVCLQMTQTIYVYCKRGDTRCICITKEATYVVMYVEKESMGQVDCFVCLHKTQTIYVYCKRGDTRCICISKEFVGEVFRFARILASVLCGLFCPPVIEGENPTCDSEHSVTLKIRKRDLVSQDPTLTRTVTPYQVPGGPLVDPVYTLLFNIE